jgi:hypothetical protein
VLWDGIKRSTQLAGDMFQKAALSIPEMVIVVV